MKTLLTIGLLLSAFSVAAQDEAPAAEEATANPRVAMMTSMGEITIELYSEEAPASVENFLEYVDNGFYAGTIFHRVIDRFMIQGGGFTEDMVKKGTRPPVANEADNGLDNTRGTVALARTGDPHSATAQFFINLVDNQPLNHRSKDTRGWGYTVFGTVVDGMDVVDAIAKVPTGVKGQFRDVPVQAVMIKSMGRVEAPAPTS